MSQHDALGPRERLLSTAWRRFAERGFAATSMDDLASELGMSKRTIYELVRDKAELLLQAAVAQLDAIDRRAEAILAADAAGHARFRELVALAIEAYRTLGPVLVYELPRRAPSAWREIKGRLDALVHRHLERVVAGRTGHRPADAVVRALTATIAGLFAARDAGEATGFIEEDVETLTDLLADGLFGPRGDAP